METCIYEVNYNYRSRVSMAFDNAHAIVHVKAPKNITRRELETLLFKKDNGIIFINKFYPISIIDLTA